MAQIFKSKDLTFSIPEKESGERPTATIYLSTVVCHTQCLCSHYSPCAFWTYQTCTCTVHTPIICYLGTFPIRNSLACQEGIDPMAPVELEVSAIKEVDTLEMLKEKLSSALKDVEGKLKEAKGK
jgi:hypothetical protein